MMNLWTLLRIPLTGQGPSYTCGVLARGMADPGFGVTIVTPRWNGFGVGQATVVQALPPWARVVPYRFRAELRSLGEQTSEAALLSGLADSSEESWAYMFPDASLELLLKLKERGVTIVREMINCHRATGKAILEDAFEKIGYPPRHNITDDSIVIEREALEFADYIICPNDMVERSMIGQGTSAAKLIPASYGWDPVRLRGKRVSHPHGSDRPFTALFVGSVSVRKGAHLLLEYWSRSNVSGRLVLAGRIEPTIREKCAHLLSRNDIVLLDYVSDVGRLYRTADAFLFPSLEEGGPQVTYEACGCGLPAITTPMGAGRVVRHNIEGFVLDPYDSEAWIAAIRTMANDRDRRRTMAAAASIRASEFVWTTVAAKRRAAILERSAKAENTTNGRVA